MNWVISNSGNAAPRPWLAMMLAPWLATGCGQQAIEVYGVPKESSPAPTRASLPAGHADVAAASTSPRFTWKLPAGWTEIPPGQMRVASFSVKGEEGKQADVSVIPLPGQAGGDAANVNRWRGQVGLPPETEEELQKAALPIEIGGQPAELQDMSGIGPNDGGATRILAAIQHRAGTAWFFKMTGDEALVARQKPAFIEFLKSFQFQPATETSTTLPPSHPPIDRGGGTIASAALSREGQPKWEPPPGWKEIPGGEFLVAKFAITGGAGAQAAVNVSKSAGDGGGLAANLNRWRGQLGQPPWTTAELEKSARQIEVAGGQATLVEMSGTDARSGQAAALAGAVVSRGGQTWFYKLMGDPKVVEGQKDAFIKFVKGVNY